MYLWIRCSAVLRVIDLPPIQKCHQPHAAENWIISNLVSRPHVFSVIRRKGGGLVHKIIWWREMVREGPDHLTGQNLHMVLVSATARKSQETRPYLCDMSKRWSFDGPKCTFIVDRRHGYHRNCLVLLTWISLHFVRSCHVTLNHHDMLHLTSRTRLYPFLHVPLKTWEWPRDETRSGL